MIHVESLALDVFKNSTGPYAISKMLPEFFKGAAKSVLKPIKDKTGQSINVDTYLGKARSDERKLIAHAFEALSKRMEAATVKHSSVIWTHLFRALKE